MYLECISACLSSLTSFVYTLCSSCCKILSQHLFHLCDSSQKVPFVLKYLLYLSSLVALYYLPSSSLIFSLVVFLSSLKSRVNHVFLSPELTKISIMVHIILHTTFNIYAFLTVRSLRG